MPRPVIMPALEMAQTTGRVIKWLKSEGDAVEKGEPLLEIETDKVTVDVEAPASGVLRQVTAQEDDEVPVGQTIAMIYAPGEEVVEPSSAEAGSAGAGDVAAAVGAGAVAAEGPVAARLAPAHPPGGESAARLSAASPKARRLAAERGVDLSSVAGSGPAGAVLAADLGHTAAVQPLSSMWRVMAERMTASWTSAPHFYLAREVRAGRLVAWLEQARRETGVRVTYTDLLVTLVAGALSRHPEVAVSWQGGALVRHEDINIGLAVAVEQGLTVPVIHQADRLNLADLVARREDVVARAGSGGLRRTDVEGSCFTISNLGMYGVDAFSAILNPPQAAILAVGRIADRVMAVDGQVAVEPGLVLTLSCDHRALDGARGARFLGELADSIEKK